MYASGVMFSEGIAQVVPRFQLHHLRQIFSEQDFRLLEQIGGGEQPIDCFHPLEIPAFAEVVTQQVETDFHLMQHVFAVDPFVIETHRDACQNHLLGALREFRQLFSQ